MAVAVRGQGGGDVEEVVRCQRGRDPGAGPAPRLGQVQEVGVALWPTRRGRSLLEEAFSGLGILSGFILIEFTTQAGSSGHPDPAVLNDRPITVRESDQIVPERDIASMKLQGDE